MEQLYSVGDYVEVKPFAEVKGKNNFPNHYERYCGQRGVVKRVTTDNSLVATDPYSYILVMDCAFGRGTLPDPAFITSEIAGKVFETNDVVCESSDASALFGGA